MGSSPLDLLKSLVVGTRLEGPARKALKLFAGSVPESERPSDLAAENDQYNQETAAVMKRGLTQNSNCVDVGCHSGAVLTDMLQAAPHGSHFAFEPIPEFYEKSVRRFAPYPNVHVYQVALSDRRGQRSFTHVTSNPELSGFLKRAFDRPDETVTEISVEAELLDNIVPENTNIDFIKIDVEGAELEVLRGAVNTIRRGRPIIVFEHGLGAADVYGTKPEEIYELLVDECDMKLGLMSGWLKGHPAMSRQQFCDQFYGHINYYFMAYP